MAYVKSNDGHDVKVASQGQANLNTVLGAVGTYGALGGFNNCGGSILSNLFGGGGWRNGNCSSADVPVTRYELAMQQAIAAKDSEIMELKANIFTDSKITETYKELRGMISNLQEVAAQQAITNTAINSAMAAMDYKFGQQIALEAERRECADCKIVNYVNSTFAPKLITEYGAGTATAAAQVYNPLDCGRCR